MKITLITLTTLLLASLTAGAQNDDRVINNAGDTIACRISVTFPGGVYKYRTSKKVKAKRITTDSLKGYYMADESAWHRRVFYGSVWFMKVIESGKINLYQMIVTTSNYGANGMWYNNYNTEWFVSKATDTAIMIKGALFGRQKRMNELADYLADNKALYDKYMVDDKFGFDQIRNLVHLYNTGMPYVEPKPKQEKEDTEGFNPNQ